MSVTCRALTILLLTLLCLTALCAGCARAPESRVIERNIRVPANLLEPLAMPTLESPVTVKSLLVHCRLLEDNTLRANERFEEIRKLQE